jgi:hypothetical protein
MQKPLAAHPVSATFFDKIEDSIRIKIQQKKAYKCWMAASNKDLVKYSNKMFEKGNSDHEEKFFKMMEKNVQDTRQGMGREHEGHCEWDERGLRRKREHLGEWYQVCVHVVPLEDLVARA